MNQSIASNIDSDSSTSDLPVLERGGTLKRIPPPPPLESSEVTQRLQALEAQNQALQAHNQQLSQASAMASQTQDTLRAQAQQLSAELASALQAVNPVTMVAGQFSHEPFSFDNLPDTLQTHPGFQHNLQTAGWWDKASAYTNIFGYVLGAGAIICFTARDWTVLPKSAQGQLGGWGFVFASLCAVLQKGIQKLTEKAQGYRDKAQKEIDKVNHHAPPPAFPAPFQGGYGGQLPGHA